MSKSQVESQVRASNIAKNKLSIKVTWQHKWYAL